MFHNGALVEQVKKEYPKGCRVKLVYMADPWGVPEGTEGTVRCVDDIGTIHVAWDNGSGLGVLMGIDVVEKV